METYQPYIYLKEIDKSLGAFRLYYYIPLSNSDQYIVDPINSVVKKEPDCKGVQKDVHEYTAVIKKRNSDHPDMVPNDGYIDINLGPNWPQTFLKVRLIADSTNAGGGNGSSTANYLI